MNSESASTASVSSLRIAVRTGEGEYRRGTGWLVTANHVVTAFHVVGVTATRGWIHQGPAEDAQYIAIASGSDLALEPVGFDHIADIAVLRIRYGNAAGVAVLPLLDRCPEVGARWDSRTFPLKTALLFPFRRSVKIEASPAG